MLIGIIGIDLLRGSFKHFIDQIIRRLNLLVTTLAHQVLSLRCFEASQVLAVWVSTLLRRHISFLELDLCRSHISRR